MIAVGDRELTLQAWTPLTHAFDVLGLRLLAVDGDHAGAQHGDQLHMGRGVIDQERAHGVHLRRLHIEEKHVG
jgi:hypothetical protein